MRRPEIDDCVILRQDIPELELSRGDMGVIRSIWCAPSVAYEVEFQPLGLDGQTRALLVAEQIELNEMHSEDTVGVL